MYVAVSASVCDPALTLQVAIIPSPQIYIAFGGILQANALGECSFTGGLLSTAGACLQMC